MTRETSLCLFAVNTDKKQIFWMHVCMCVCVSTHLARMSGKSWVLAVTLTMGPGQSFGRGGGLQIGKRMELSGWAIMWLSVYVVCLHTTAVMLVWIWVRASGPAVCIKALACTNQGRPICSQSLVFCCLKPFDILSRNSALGCTVGDI